MNIDEQKRNKIDKIKGVDIPIMHVYLNLYEEIIKFSDFDWIVCDAVSII